MDIEINSENFPGLRSAKNSQRANIDAFFGSMQSFGRHYDAGEKNRLTNDWRTQYGSPSQNFKQSWRDIIARSIDSFDNNPNTQALKNALLNNVIGSGMRPIARVRDGNGKLIEGINKQLNEGWKRYNETWDAGKRVDQQGSQAIRFHELLRTGTVMTHPVLTRRNDSYLALQNQIFNVLRLDSSHDTTTPTFDIENVATTVFGINLDKYGAALSYWIEGAENPIKELMFAFKQDVAEQYIGTPPLIAALKFLWFNETLTMDKVVASRIQSMINIFIPNGTANTLGYKNMNSDNETEIAQGKYLTGKVGEEPKIVQADDSIRDVLIPLQKLLMHAITMTMGVSYQSVTRDLEKTNMASGRINTNEDRKAYRALQNFVIKKINAPDWNLFVRQMFIEGKIAGRTILDYEKDPYKYSQHSWLPNGFDLIDPAKESLAAIELINNNMLTYEEWYGDRGKDYREMLQQRAKEKSEAEELGLTVEEVVKEESKNDLAKTRYIDDIDI